MCTAVTYKTKNFYFGRTLDNGFSYKEEVVITPRNFVFNFRATEDLKEHYAIIGTAFVPDKFPLYYDACNEKGLCMAGLNFVGNAFYMEKVRGKNNVAQFEFIPYILGKCSSVKEALKELKKVNVTPENYDKDLPVAQLHWLIADKTRAVTVEFVKEGLKIYENSVGVLTNNPPFDEQLFHLNNYMALSPKPPKNNFCKDIKLKTYSYGMGALGLPGDLSSQSRFVRAAFVKLNSVSADNEEESVSQFFHILGSVEQPRGCSIIGRNEYEITVYTSCCNADKGIYYYTTYGNRSITGADMFAEDLNGKNLKRYPFVKGEKINIINRKK